MDRPIVFPDEIPLDTDFLTACKSAMVGLGMALQAILGGSTVVDGLGCTPTGPASLTVLIGQGSIYSTENVDGTAYGSLGSDTAHQIVKQGISLGTTTLPSSGNIGVPVTTGYSVNYLVQVQYQDVDTGAVVLPYYDASNPSVAYSGPANAGTPQNNLRQGKVVIQLKAGTAATTGTQTTPAPDAGFTSLWVITVANGATQITSGNISQYSGAPFINYKLPQLSPAGSTSPVGTATKISAYAASPAATLAYTADEVVVATAIGGSYLSLANFSKTVNLGSTGAGGMDTGSPPATGFVSVYAIAKSDGTQSILACNASTSSGSVYSGSNLPSGYTYSALLGIWPTNGSSLFVVGTQIDKKFYMPSVNALNTGSPSTTAALISLSSIIPAAARRVRGIGGSNNSDAGLWIAADASATGKQLICCDAIGNVGTEALDNFDAAMPFEVPIVASQEIYYKTIISSYVTQVRIDITGYDI